MNTHKASALLHYLAAVKRQIGVKDLQPAARFRRHGLTRTDKPSGAQRRYALRYGGKYRFDKKAKVWRLQTGPTPVVALWRKIGGRAQPTRTPRGNLRNPTVLR